MDGSEQTRVALAEQVMVVCEDYIAALDGRDRFAEVAGYAGAAGLSLLRDGQLQACEPQPGAAAHLAAFLLELAASAAVHADTRSQVDVAWTLSASDVAERLAAPTVAAWLAYAPS